MLSCFFLFQSNIPCGNLFITVVLFINLFSFLSLVSFHDFAINLFVFILVRAQIMLIHCLESLFSGSTKIVCLSPRPAGAAKSLLTTAASTSLITRLVCSEATSLILKWLGLSVISATETKTLLGLSLIKPAIFLKQKCT